jgi:pimeloyl-ACP methyl ester carboxylesterase
VTEALPRRAFLGTVLAPAGLAVVAIRPGSMAHQAGIRPRDRLVALDGPLSDVGDLHGRLRAIARSGEATLGFERDGALREATVPVQPVPLEEIAGCEVRYDHIEVPGARLRTIVTRPAGGDRYPAVLFIPGIACASVDFGSAATTPTARLVHGWAGSGLVTMRVERRGLGDSEGAPCSDASFLEEVDWFAAGLRALARLAFVKESAIAVFGHSVGGMIAPLLEREGVAGGYVVYGTSCWRWRETMLATIRRQLALYGLAAEKLERRMELYGTLYRALFEEGLSPAEAVAREPALSVCADPTFGRALAYVRELDGAELAAAWGRTARPVLAMHGEHDWVVGEEEARALVEAVNARSPGHAELLPVPLADHLLTEHPSRHASVNRHGDGPLAAPIVEETVRFARALPGAPWMS